MYELILASLKVILFRDMVLALLLLELFIPFFSFIYLFFVCVDSLTIIARVLFFHGLYYNLSLVVSSLIFRKHTYVRLNSYLEASWYFDCLSLKKLISKCSYILLLRGSADFSRFRSDKTIYQHSCPHCLQYGAMLNCEMSSYCYQLEAWVKGWKRGW